MLALRPCGGATQGVLLYAPAVTVSRLEVSARAEDGPVRVQWQTTLELGINAFRVVRQRNGGAPEPVGSGYVHAQGDEAGGTYALTDLLVLAGDRMRYELLAVSPHVPDQPVAQWNGVIGTVTEPPQPRKTSATVSGGAPLAPAALSQSWIGAGARVRAWADRVQADRVRLGLREEGVYRVSAQEIADAAGWDAASVTAAIAGTNLSLSCQGVPVAWYSDRDTLFFHGVPAASRFAPENVYWIARGQGVHMSRQVVPPATPATTNEWFFNAVTQQGTDYLARVGYSTLADAPASYVAFPGLLLAGGAKQYAASLIDCADGVWTGTVTVNLLSYYEVGTDEHAARVSIGGTPLGEAAWTNEQYVSFSFPFSSTNLTGDTAVLKLENIGAAPQWGATDSTRFLCISYGFSYPRLYRARNGALRCTGGVGDTIAVSGFASNDVMVLDVTVPRAPVVVEPVTVTCDGMDGNWSAAFSCGGSGQVYQVCSKSVGTRQPAVRGVRDVDWAAPANAADYVILIPPEAWRDGFREAMQPLADFRNAQGLRTKVVDVEALYDAFSYGLVDPLAIRAFCATAYTNGLKYLLLAGAGALDFKHERLSVNDYTACLIPTLIAGQRFSSGEGMTVALDAALGDVDGDGGPDVAVGRLPTALTQELAVAVQKTISYDGVLPWKRQASVAADWNNTGNKYYSFSAGTDRLSAPLESAGRTVVKHYIDASTSGDDVLANSLIPALRSGSGLFHFFGHGNNQTLGGGTDKLLYMHNITSENWARPPIAVIIACVANRWQSFTATACILAYGLFAADTGFVAGLGATGYMLADEGEELAVSLYTDGAGQGAFRLGDVLRRGLQRSVGKVPTERLLCYSLIGDPALTFKVTATVSFNPGGGTGIPLSFEVIGDSTYGVLPTPIRRGYTFSGWWTGPGGTGTRVTESTPVTTPSDHMIYAAWVEDPYLCTTEEPAELSSPGSYDGFFYGKGAFDGHMATAVRGTLELKITTRSGRLTAKAITQKGALSFSSRTWASTDTNGTCHAVLATRGGETLDLNVSQNHLGNTHRRETWRRKPHA